MLPYSSENFSCPYCGSENMFAVDLPGHSAQSFVQDCEVCCKPIQISYEAGSDESITGLTVNRLDA